MALNLNDPQVYMQVKKRVADMGLDVNEFDKYIQKKQSIESMAQNVTGGFQSLQDIPVEQRSAVAEALRLSGQQPPDTSTSASDRKFIASSETGMTAVDKIRNILDTDKEKEGLEERKKLLLKTIPMSLGARDLSYWEQQAIDVIGRLRTGAVINDDEEKRFADLMPSILDDDKLIKEKLDTLDREFARVAKKDPKQFIQSLVGEDGGGGIDLSAFSQYASEKDKSSGATKSKSASGYVSGSELDKLYEQLPLGNKPSGSKSNAIKQEPGQDNDLIKNILLKGADVAPAVGAAVGGFGGGVSGSVLPVAGTLGGSVLGGALGGSVGYTIQQNIRRLLGETQGVDEYGVESLKGMGEEATKAAISEAIGYGAGKVVGWGLKGGNLIIRGIGNTIDEIPLKQFNIKPLDQKNFYQKFKQPMEDFIVKNGYFGDDGVSALTKDIDAGQATFDNLFKNKGVEVPVKEVVTQFKNKIDDLAGVQGATTRVKQYAKDLTKEIDNFVDVYGINNTIPADELSKLRGVVDDLVSPKEWVENPVLKKVYTDLRRIYNDSIKSVVSKRLVGDGSEEAIKQLDEVGAELSKRYDLLEMINDRQFSGSSSPISKTVLSALLAGSGIGGTMLGGPAGGIGAAGGVLALEQILKNKGVQKGVYQAGKMATNVGTQATNPAISAAAAPAGGASAILLQKLLGL